VARQHRDEDGGGESLFSRVMRERGRPSRTIDFPGLKGVKVALWAPTEGEEAEADAEARTHLTKVLGLDALQLSLAVETALHSRERDVQLLAQVLRDPSDPEQAFVESPDELRDGLEPPQRVALVAAIKDFQDDRYNPTLPSEDTSLAGLIRDLKAEGGLSSFWTSCDGDTRLRIVHALAAPLQTQTPENSSAT